MNAPFSIGRTTISTRRSDRTASAFRRLTAFVLVFFLILGTLSAPVQAAITVKEPDASLKNRTTMYVSSTLSGRHGLCVLLENVDGAGRKQFGLIDTGNANTSAMRAFLDKHGVKTLDFLIMTHMHNDHYGNTVWVINNYNVKKLYIKQFDSTWSNGNQAVYEKIIRAAVLSPNVKQIYGVGYGLSVNKTASPKASKSFVDFLKAHGKDKYKFKGLFNSSNTALYLGAASLRIFNWEIWASDGTGTWVPGKNFRCKVQQFAPDRSDNHYSLGVRVTRGSEKIWIGGDMTNLRLKNMRHAPYEGDEDRLASQIGKVNVAVLNHHGRGGSNAASFLRTLKPSYVVYTSTKAEIMSGGNSFARSTLNFIRNTLHLKNDHILWAYDYWGSHLDDVAVTLTSNGKTSSSKSGSTANTGSSANKALTASLLPGNTYSNYDVTGDGKKDIVTISAPKSGSNFKGLSISVNKKVVWSTKVSFKDKKPVTLVRLPGSKPYVCISILSPSGNKGKGKVLGLYRYGKIGSTGSKFGLAESYNYLTHMPISKYTYRTSPSISCTAKRITVVTSGSDTLSSNAFVTFALELNKGTLKPVDTVYPYTTVMGKTGTIKLKTKTKLYGWLDAEKKSTTLAKGKKVTVVGVRKNKAGKTRYRIIDSKKKVWWIDAPSS